MLDELGELAEGREAAVAAARELLAGEEPEIGIGDHCSTPFDCEFAAYCQRALPFGPEWPATLLPYGGGKK